MKVTVDQLPQRQIVLNIEAEAEELEKSKQQAYRHLVGNARVPGFRRGKAPIAMLERHYGKAVFMEEVIHHLVPDVTSKAIEEQKLTVAGQPDIEIVDTDPIVWKATIDLVPEVELKGYLDIRITREPVNVEPKQVNEALEQIRFSQAPWEPVARKAVLGDMVTVDVYAEEGDQKVADDQAVQYQIVEGSAAPLPGFAEQLVGLGDGESKEFVLSPAGEEHEDKIYSFKVTVHDVKAKSLIPLDDEFAKGVGEGFDSLRALRAQVKDQIRDGANREAKEALREKALQAVIAKASLVYSPGIIRHEAEHMLKEQEERLGRNKMSMDEYLQGIGKSREELVDDLKPAAEERVERSIVMAELQKKEDVEVSDSEIDDEIARFATNSSDEGQSIERLFQSDQGRQSLRQSILTRKTLDRLVEIVDQPRESNALAKPKGKSTKANSEKKTSGRKKGTVKSAKSKEA